MPVIAFISSGGAIASRAVAFRNGLSEASYVEGRNVTLAPELLADVVHRRVAVIVMVTPSGEVEIREPACSQIPSRQCVTCYAWPGNTPLDVLHNLVPEIP
jgi:hypothetical protein